MRKLQVELAIVMAVVLLGGSSLWGAEGPWEPAGLQPYNIWALEISPTGVRLAGTTWAPADKIFRSVDDGQTWSETTGLPGAQVWDIEFDPSNESIVYAALNGPGVYKSLDGGSSWSWSNLDGQIWQIAVSPTDPFIVYVASQTGGVYKSEDGGVSWVQQDLGGVTNATAVAVHPSDPDIALAGTPIGGVFKTTNGGLTWFGANNGLELGPSVLADIRSFLIDPADPLTVYAGELWAGVYKSLDGGINWYKPDPSLAATVVAIEQAGDDLYIINTFGNRDPVYRSRDAGLSWEPLPIQPELGEQFWPRSLAVIPTAVLLGTELFPNEGGIYRWPLLSDADGDGVLDDVDNCPATPNPGQSDADGDTLGDLCDECPGDPTQTCDPGGSTADEISAEDGGSLETPDGAVKLDIDPGDLAEDATLSITEVAPIDPTADLVLDDGNGAGDFLATYLFEPDGLVFDSPVTVTVTFDVSGLNRGQRRQIDLYLYADTDGDGVEDGHVALGALCPVVEVPVGTFIATCTAQIEHFSVYSLVAPLDSDGDEVPDRFGTLVDLCSDTVIPEGVPYDDLKHHRFALMDADTVFDTNRPPGKGRAITYEIGQTAGCSCEQIIEVLGLGNGQRKFGCSNSVMQHWLAGLSE